MTEQQLRILFIAIDRLITRRIQIVLEMKPTDDPSKDFDKFEKDREKIVNQIIPIFQEPRRRDDKGSIN